MVPTHQYEVMRKYCLHNFCLLEREHEIALQVDKYNIEEGNEELWPILKCKRQFSSLVVKLHNDFLLQGILEKLSSLDELFQKNKPSKRLPQPINLPVERA